MAKECLWYDGIERCYWQLDFDPNELDKGQVIEKAERQLKKLFGLHGRHLRNAIEGVFLMDLDRLEKVKEDALGDYRSHILCARG